MSINARMHTGCGCYHCRRGRNKQTRKEYTRKIRRLHKKQLKKFGEIIDPVLSIGYTD